MGETAAGGEAGTAWRRPGTCGAAVGGADGTGSDAAPFVAGERSGGDDDTSRERPCFADLLRPS